MRFLHISLAALLMVPALALGGSLAYLTCDPSPPSGACAASSLQLASRDLTTGATSVLARFPNASLDTLGLSASAINEAEDALFISLVAADGASGELVRYSLSQHAIVARVAAPACGFLAVVDAASLVCLTDAPYYGVDGSSYVLRVDVGSGVATHLATWKGSPVPEDVVAVLDASKGVLYAVLLDEAADQELILGWHATTGKQTSQVLVPDAIDFLNAVWDSSSARVLGTLNNRTRQTRDFRVLDLAQGTSISISHALQNYTTVYGIAAAAPALRAVFFSAYKAKGVHLVGLEDSHGRVVYEKPADDLYTSIVYLP